MLKVCPRIQFGPGGNQATGTKFRNRDEQWCSLTRDHSGVILGITDQVPLRVLSSIDSRSGDGDGQAPALARRGLDCIGPRPAVLHCVACGLRRSVVGLRQGAVHAGADGFVQSFFLVVDPNPANHGGLLTVEEARELAAALAGVATDKQLAVCNELLRGCRPTRRHIRSGVV
jgi:hypothetical protein